MRLSLWLFVCLIYLQFPTYSFGNGNTQADKKITLSGTLTLHTIFRKIEEQTSKRIYYTNSILNDDEKVSVNIIDGSIQQVLSQILSKKNLEWSIEEKFISIRKGNNKIESSSVLGADTTINVSGRVVNEKGEGIAGATILIKGTKTGVTAAANGSFSLSNVSPNASLTISNIAYISQEIRLKGKTRIGDIQLQEYIGKLDETIVIAYGTTSQRFSTGNVSTIKAADIEKQPVNNPLLALQGRVSGLFITQATGYAGTGVTVRIQGQNSIFNGNDPLYVIDGVPYTSQLMPTINQIIGNSGTGNDQYSRPISGNPLSYINTDDIESIDVLKDADATAIYGSRAANGAILITTKRGKAGKINVDFSVQNGWGKVASKLDIMNSAQYLEMRKEALKNDDLTANPNKDYDLFNNYGWDTSRNTDWQKSLIGRTVHLNNFQSSVSGGSENVQFLVGGTYRRETAAIPGNFADQKGALHFNISATSANKKFKLLFTGNYLLDNNRLPGVDLTPYAMRLAPTAPNLYNQDRSINWAVNASGKSTWGFGRNPVSQLEYKYRNKTNNTTGNMTLSYLIIPGLELKSSFGYNKLQSDESKISPITAAPPEERPFTSRITTVGTNTSNSWIIEPQLSYQKNFGMLKFDALFGGTIQNNNNSTLRLYGTGYASDQVLGSLSTASNIFLTFSSTSEYKYNAAFSRLNFNLKDEFIFNFTARRDGSSRFGSQNLYHTFGSLAGAWIFTQRDFIKRNMAFLSFGKIRASYGTTGSDQISDYKFLTLYTPTYSLPYQNIPGMLPESFSNPYLQWEETKKIQMGLDLGFLNDRFLFTANYFRNRSANQLLQYNLPIVTGFRFVTSNFPATVQNSGWELSIFTTNVKSKDFTWSSNFNITIPKNKLVKFPGLETSTYSSLLIVGQPLTVVKTFNFAGVNPTTGVYQFTDATGKITSNPADPKDKYVTVDINPKLYGGFQNSFSYKSISLDVMLQFVKQLGANYKFGSNPGYYEGTNGNQPLYVLDRWQRAGDITNTQRYNSNLSIITPLSRARSSNASFSNATYIRLKNLSLNWKLPENWIKKVNIKNAQIFVHGQNLLTITSYKGLDPETRSITTLPPLKILTVGLKASL
jgi:TonB-linked SusC/RagA family outer membrane protein